MGKGLSVGVMLVWAMKEGPSALGPNKNNEGIYTQYYNIIQIHKNHTKHFCYYSALLGELHHRIFITGLHFSVILQFGDQCDGICVKRSWRGEQHPLHIGIVSCGCNNFL